MTFIFCAAAVAQTDSLEQKLLQYKSLFEKGLITQQEYDAVKASVLKIAPPAAQQTEKISASTLDDLNKKWKGQVRGGCILVPMGVCFGAGAWIYASKSYDVYDYYQNGSFNQQLFDAAVKRRKTASIIIASAGGVIIGAGTGLLIAGSINKAIWKDKKSKLTAGIGPNGLGLVYLFK